MSPEETKGLLRIFCAWAPESIVGWIPDLLGKEEEFLPVLSREEQAQYWQLRNKRRRRSFLHGRLVLRLLAAHACGSTPSQVPLEVQSNGAPVLKGSPHFCSLAHTDWGAAAVLASVPVGIDIEYIQPRNPALARYFLSPSEWEQLQGLFPEVEVALLQGWTMKEAVLKAQQTGLRYSPRKLQIERIQEGKARVSGGINGSEWVVYFGRYEGHCWALAFQNKPVDSGVGTNIQKRFRY